MPGPIQGAGFRSEFPLLKTEGPTKTERSREPSQSDGVDLGDAFADALDRASTDDSKASEMAEAFAAGDPKVGLHEVMIASERANISVRYTVTMKNKLLEAYRDLMNTQV